MLVPKQTARGGLQLMPSVRTTVAELFDQALCFLLLRVNQMFSDPA